jgi:hypothetical protein
MIPQQRTKRYFLSIGLLLVALIILISLAVSLYRSKYSQQYSVIDPDSGQTILYNGSGDKTVVSKSPILLLSSPRLLSLGMTNAQYSALNANLISSITALYGKKYTIVSENTNSTVYDDNAKRFSFKARLGDVNSKTYVYITVGVQGDGSLDVAIKDSQGKTLKQTTVTVS